MALDVAHQIVAYLVNGTIENAVNVPSVSGEIMKLLQPYLQLAEKIGKLQGQMAVVAPNEVVIEFAGEITKLPTPPITVSVLRGLLEPILEDESVNAVNAPYIAKERGIKLTESKISDHENFASLITVTLKFKDKQTVVAGTIFGKNHPRIVRVDNYYLEAVPEGKILVILNQDKPGVVGNVGTCLAKNKINISRMQLGLDSKTGKATAFYNVEGDVSDKVLAELKKLPDIISVQQVVL